MGTQLNSKMEDKISDEIGQNESIDGFTDPLRRRSIAIRADPARKKLAPRARRVKLIVIGLPLAVVKCCDSSFDCVLSSQQLVTLWIAPLVKTADYEGVQFLSASRGPSAEGKIRQTAHLASNVAVCFRILFSYNVSGEIFF